MVSLEARNNRLQQPLTNFDKIENSQNSAELEASCLDALKPHASALLGSTLEIVPVAAKSTPSFFSIPQSTSIAIDQVRAARCERFEQTGHTPPIAGGSQKGEQQASEEEDEEMQKIDKLIEEMEEDGDRKLDELDTKIDKELERREEQLEQTTDKLFEEDTDQELDDSDSG